MAAKIYQTAASTDLKAYLSTWASVDPLSAYGEFSPTTSPYDQWAGGDEGGTRLTNSVLLEGDFTYGVGGDFVGTVDTLTFGSGLSGDASSGFSIDTAQLTIDLGGASAITAFDYAIYGLMGTAGTVTLGYLYAYFDAVGTEQYGTAGNDTQYSFAGNDSFTGYGGNDTFVFDDNWATDLATDFGSASGNTDILDFTAVSGITDVNDLVNNYSNWYDSTAPLTISDGTNTLTLAGYVGSDIFTLQANNQLLA
ncbi:MAG TPA: hemolysin [Tardiphaga sp.]